MENLNEPTVKGAKVIESTFQPYDKEISDRIGASIVGKIVKESAGNENMKLQETGKEENRKLETGNSEIGKANVEVEEFKPRQTNVYATGENYNVYTTEKNYLALKTILLMAYDRAAKTKGLERHSDGQPFEQQDICQELRIFKSVSPALFQARKKIKESIRLDNKGGINELLDAMVYLSAAVIVMREMANGN